MFFSVALLFILPLVAASYNATNIQALFGPSLSSGAEIFLPSYANYTEDVQQRWSAWAAPSYIAVIKVATAKDVQSIVSKVMTDQGPYWELTKYQLRLKLRLHRRYHSSRLLLDMVPHSPMAACMMASISISAI